MPLLERTRELEQLDAAWTGAVGGRGSVVLIEGEAGIGKTALLNHLRAVAGDQEALVLQSRCGTVTPSSPHAVARDWFGRLAGEVGVGNPPFDGPGALLGGAGAGAGGVPGELAYAARWVLEDLGRERPTLLIVDDVQWADAASLGFLDLLAGALDELPVLLLLAQRTGEQVSAPEQLLRMGRLAVRLRPSPLSEQAVGALLADLDSSVASEVARLSGGVPFFVEEMGEARRNGSTGPPSSVVDHVAARLARLPPAAAAVARAAAILEGAISPPDAAAMAELPVTDARDLLSRLVGAGILDEEHRPRHPLVAEAILAALTPGELAEQHRRAAVTLTTRGAPDRVVAAHWIRSEPGARPHVRDLLFELGCQVLAEGQAAAAAVYLRRAVAECGIAAAGVDLLRVTARASSASGDLEGALVLWRRAADVAGDVKTAVLVLSELGDALVMAGRSDEAYEVYRAWTARLDAAHGAGDGTTRKELTARSVLSGAIHRGLGPDTERLLWSVLAQPPRLDRQGDRLILAAAAAGLTFTASAPASRVRALVERSTGQGPPLKEETFGSGPFYTVVGLLTWSDAFDQAVALLDDAVAEARARSSTQALASATYARGFVHLRRGAVTAALADFSTAETLRRLGWEFHTPVLLAGLVECHVVRGDLGAMQALAGELNRFAHTAVGIFGSFALFGLGDIAQAEGRHEDAIDLFDRVAANAAGAHDNPAIMMFLGRKAMSLAHLGRHDEANEVAEANLARSEAWGSPRVLAEALYVAAVAGRADQREVRLRRVRELTESLPLTRARHEAGVALADLLATRGEYDEAVGLARAALEHADAEELSPLAGRAAAVLVRLGHRVYAGPVRGLLLTPGERRAADLAAAGLTNREIAGQMFVTVKAVEWNLVGAYRKLGISSRHQLPAVLGHPPVPEHPLADDL